MVSLTRAENGFLFVDAQYGTIPSTTSPSRRTRFPMENTTCFQSNCAMKEAAKKKTSSLLKNSNPLIEAVHCPDYLQRLLARNWTKKRCAKLALEPTTYWGIIIAGVRGRRKTRFPKDGMRWILREIAHHAFRAWGEAFCLLNDQAIAAQYPNQKEVQKILIVDLDVHQGNGTEIFKDNLRVYFFCTPEQKLPFSQREKWPWLSLGRWNKDTVYLKPLSHFTKVDWKSEAWVHFYLCESMWWQRINWGFRHDPCRCKANDQFVLETCLDQNIPVQCAWGCYLKTLKSS